MKKLKNYLWGKKGFTAIAALTIIALCFFGTNKSALSGKKAVVVGMDSDTCTVQHQNFWTGNYRLTDKEGKEFSAKPQNVLLVDGEFDYTRN